MRKPVYKTNLKGRKDGRTLSVTNRPNLTLEAERVARREAAVAAFLARGGTVEKVPSGQ